MQPEPSKDPFQAAFEHPLGRLLRDLSWLFCVIYYWLLHKKEIVGSRNIPRRGPVLVIANHTSHLDPPLVSTITRRRLRFMAKQELFEVKPWFASYLSVLGAYPIRRDGVDRESMRRTITYLRDGQIVLIFPEGTRSEDGQLQEFNIGAASIAAAVPEAQILPVRIHGAFESWPSGRSFPRPHPIRVVIGKPFRLADMPDLPKEKKALYRAVSDEMLSRLSAL